ncbi:MAG: nucleotidyltransferase domain-containing protein [Candidatus Wolfebacteria bacterium]|nr:nucleotidyltransferase domain-containing protein [Candidatus Wolfebacteria bacterium]
MKNLQELIENLKSQERVDAAFLTGSFGALEANKFSDIDLVVISGKNAENIKSVYEKIDGIFADIFFFDKTDLERLLDMKELDGNSTDGILLSWIAKADIKFDKSGLVGKIKNRASEIRLFVSDIEKRNVLQQISYNHIQNRRHFDSGENKYREALKIRLMYSVVELITGFLALRGESWRGEKSAINFIKVTDSYFYQLFLDFDKKADIENKMKIYEEMVKRVLPQGISLYSYDGPICLSKDKNTEEEIDKLRIFWEEISGGK